MNATVCLACLCLLYLYCSPLPGMSQTCFFLLPFSSAVETELLLPLPVFHAAHVHPALQRDRALAASALATRLSRRGSSYSPMRMSPEAPQWSYSFLPHDTP